MSQLWESYATALLQPSDYGYLGVLNEGLLRLRSQDEFLFDCFCQPIDDCWTPGVIVAASRLYYAWMKGWLEFAVIEIGEEPPPDAALKNWQLRLPKPFEVELWGGLGDHDGIIMWHEPIAFLNPQSMQLRFHHPHYAPIEVGTCHPAKILFALAAGKYIARIPYGHPRILILYEP